MTDPVGDLERLQKLRAEGALNEAEFAAAKARLLSPSFSPPATEPVRPPWHWLVVGAAIIGVAGLGYMLVSPVSRSDGPAATNATDTAPTTNQVAVAPPPTIRDRPAAEQLAAAFRAAWGRDGSATRRIGDGVARFTPGRLVWLGERAALISPGTIPDACHGCSGTLAVHYLRPTPNGFDVEREWLDRAGGSSWGSPASNWEVSMRFGPYPVIYAEGGGTWQGYTRSSARLTELAPTGPIPSEIVPVHMDNGGAVLPEPERTSGGEAPRNVTGQIVAVQSGRGFAVRFTGTERFVETYVYRAGRFVRTSGESRATC